METNEIIRVRVCNLRFQASHGKQPRGYGNWAFETVQGETFLMVCDTFANARKKAVLEAARKGIAHVYVGS